jgi:hypothetical protein
MTTLKEAIKKGDFEQKDPYQETAELCTAGYLQMSKDYIRVAHTRGWIVVVPKPNQLQIDIDSEDQYTEFKKRLPIFESVYPSSVEAFPSKSGLPRRHITITADPTIDKKFTDIERVAWQSLLGSDPIREILSMIQILNEDPNPVLFSEKAPTKEGKS